MKITTLRFLVSTALLSAAVAAAAEGPVAAAHAVDADGATWGGPGMHADYVPDPASAPVTSAGRGDRGMASRGADMHSDYPVDDVAVPPAPPSPPDALAWGGPGMHSDTPAVYWPAVPPNHADAGSVAAAHVTHAPAPASALIAPLADGATQRSP
jgi:hypothetical protein